MPYSPSDSCSGFSFLFFMIIFLFKWLGEGRGTPSSSFGRQEQKNYQITWALFVKKDMYCQKTKGPKTLTGWLSKGSFRSMSPKVSEQMQAILYCWFLLLKAIIIRRKTHQPVVKSTFSFFFFFNLSYSYACMMSSCGKSRCEKAQQLMQAKQSRGKEC